MEKRDTFGTLLKFYRKRTKDSKHNLRPLSQQRLADELKHKEGFTYSYGTVSLWERDKLQFPPDGRLLLKTILKVLLHFKGINQLDEANELLRLGGHSPLTHAEVENIHARWQLTKPAAYSIKIAGHEIQRAALPQQLELQGKDGAFQMLDEQLCQPLASSVVFLTGRGGVGKSSVATALAHKHLTSDIFEAVSWISFNLPDEQSAEAAIESVIDSLGKWLQIKHLVDATPAGRKALIRGALEAKAHLVVIDGVEAPAHCDALNTRLSAMAGRSKFLVTSRIIPTTISQAFVYSLDEINVEQSQQLLQAQTQATNGIPAEEFTPEVVKKIHSSIGGHPLTLILFPHLLKRHNLDSLLQAIELGVEGKHTFIYGRLWEMLSPESKKLVMALCFFGGLGADETTLKIAAELNESEFFQATREIGQFGLLQSRGGLDKKIHNLHNLTIQYVQILVRQTADQQDFIDAIKRTFNFWLNYFAGLQSTLPYDVVLQLHQTLRISQILQDNTDIGQLRCRLLYTIFTPLKNHDFLNSWETVWQAAVSNDIGSNELFECRLINQLAYIKQEKQDFNKALELHKKALELGYNLEETVEIAQAHHHLSWCYYRLGEFDLAAENNSTAVHMFEDFDIQSEDYVKARLRGGILLIVKEQFKRAETVFLELVDHLEKSSQHQYLVQVYQNLGYLYYVSDQYRKAQKAYRAARKYLEKFPNEIKKIRILIAESALHTDHDNFEAAYSAIEKIDTDFLRETFNYNLLNAALGNLALVHIGFNEFEKAEKLLTELLAYWVETDQHYDRLLLMETWADLHAKKGDLPKALSVLHQTLTELEGFPSEAKIVKLIKSVQNKISKYS